MANMKYILTFTVVLLSATSPAIGKTWRVPSEVLIIPTATDSATVADSIPVAPDSFQLVDDSTQVHLLSFSFGLGVVRGFPQGEFKRNIGNPPLYGFKVDFMVSFERYPFSLGFNFSYLLWGHLLLPFPESPTGKASFFREISAGHFVARAVPRNGFVRPYVEALVGSKQLRADTGLFTDGHDIVDNAFSFGGALGLLLTFHRWDKGNYNLDMVLDMRAGYLFGKNVTYVNEVVRNNGEVVFETVESETDFMSVYVGLVLQGIPPPTIKW